MICFNGFKDNIIFLTTYYFCKCKLCVKLLFYLQFVSESTNTLKAIHETPSKHYKDDLTFTFSDAGMNCKTEVLCNVYFYVLPLVMQG